MGSHLHGDGAHARFDKRSQSLTASLGRQLAVQNNFAGNDWNRHGAVHNIAGLHEYAARQILAIERDQLQVVGLNAPSNRQVVGGGCDRYQIPGLWRCGFLVDPPAQKQGCHPSTMTLHMISTKHNEGK